LWLISIVESKYEGSYLSNSDPKKPYFNSTKKVAYIATAVALIGRIIEKDAKFFGVDSREIENQVKNIWLVRE
jgi:hypothetical protein